MKKLLFGFFCFYMFFSMIFLPFSTTFLFQSIHHIFFQEYTIELDLNEENEEEDLDEEENEDDDSDEDEEENENDSDEDDDSLST